MLSTETLRRLDLDRASAPGRPSHLAAASGLQRVGDWLYVIADDELHLGAFPARSDGRGRLLRLFEGTLPDDYAARKAAKPDLEVLLRLPPQHDWPHGALLALASGSRPSRSLGALLPLQPDGAPAGAARALQLAPFHAVLRDALPAPNLEGGAIVGDELWLFSRASRQQTRNAVLRFALGPWLAALRGEASFEAAPPFVPDWLALDDDDGGIGFGITDAAALPDGGVVFCAVTEDSADSYVDGPCAAAGVGLLGPDRVLRDFRRLATPAKVEGIEARCDGDRLQLLLVTDADDAAVAARLLRAEWRPRAPAPDAD